MSLDQLPDVAYSLIGLVLFFLALVRINIDNPINNGRIKTISFDPSRVKVSKGGKISEVK